MEETGFGPAADKLAIIVRDCIGLILDPAKKLIMNEVDIVTEKRRASQQWSIEKQDILNRTKARLYETELQRQVNLEDVVGAAMDSLTSKANPEKLSKDWLNYFFSSCQDVSEDALKDLWGKILAKECEPDAAISKMTLDRLRNMSHADCLLFEEFNSKVSELENMPMLLKYKDTGYFAKDYHFHFSQFMHLCDLGLINNSEIGNYTLEPRGTATLKTTVASYSITNKGEADQKLDLYLLTTAGNQLRELCTKKCDDRYFTKLFLSYATRSIVVNKRFDQENNSSRFSLNEIIDIGGQKKTVLRDNPYLHDNVD